MSLSTFLQFVGVMLGILSCGFGGFVLLLVFCTEAQRPTVGKAGAYALSWWLIVLGIGMVFDALTS